MSNTTLIQDALSQMKEVYNALADVQSQEIFKIRANMLFSDNQDYEALQEYSSELCQKLLETHPMYKYSRPLRQIYLLPSRPFIIFGTGEIAERMFQEISSRFPYQVLFDGREILFATESPSLKEFHGYYVISLEEIINDYKTAQVLLATEDSEDNIAFNLHKAGFDRNQILHREIYEDTETQYFDSDIIQYGKHEIFVDAGALDGKTSKTFLKQCSGVYDKIHVFEPNLSSLEKAKETLKTYQNCHFYPVGLWNQEETLFFGGSAPGGFGIARGEADISLPVTALDQILGDEKVTFLKMDVEGAELEALEGAKHIIAKYKPKLAISLYHKAEDLYVLPLWVKNLVPEYQLYIRHYSSWHYETVLYAVMPN